MKKVALLLIIMSVYSISMQLAESSKTNVKDSQDLLNLKSSVNELIRRADKYEDYESNINDRVNNNEVNVDRSIQYSNSRIETMTVVVSIIGALLLAIFFVRLYMFKNEINLARSDLVVIKNLKEEAQAEVDKTKSILQDLDIPTTRKDDLAVIPHTTPSTEEQKDDL